MARPIDYAAARSLLEAVFATAETDFSDCRRADVPPIIEAATDQLMRSATQAYREVLIGCCLARVLDPSIDVHLPYANQGDLAYNGRSLDELVVNPFLQGHEIPASRGPFLSVFRRSVAFAPTTRSGVRDKVGFDALLKFIDALGEARVEAAREYLRHLLGAFIQLRDASNVDLLHVQRLSLEQYEKLMGQLLQVPSGGRFPMLLTVAMFRTIREAFGLDWEIEWQGINVADRASDVGGDITVHSGKHIILSVEVTERPIDRARVEATFNNKILKHNLVDYLFFYASIAPTDEARVLVRRYFNQGHDINFLPLEEWLIHSLATIGGRYRPEFTGQVIGLLRNRDVPTGLKLAWNAKVRNLLEL